MALAKVSSLSAALSMLAMVAAADTLGDAEKGAQVFKKCRSCHQVGPEAKSGVGPHLNGLFGRTPGSVEGFDYSDGLTRLGVSGAEWHADNLDIYIENPRALASDTRMNFRGIKDADDRQHLLAYLRTFSDNPRDIPEADPTAQGSDHAVDPAILAIVGDPEYGEYLSSECTTCHQANGADLGIPSITGWPAENFVVAMHAYKSNVREHPVMQMVAGRLSDDEIAALAAYFEGM